MFGDRVIIRDIEKWSKVRFVRGRSGRYLVSDGRVLCGTDSAVAESNPVVLANGETAVNLENRACSNDHLPDTGSLPVTDARAFTVEKVRILMGKHAGLEGWVRAYGLQEAQPSN